jgi:hypothetical protein
VGTERFKAVLLSALVVFTSLVASLLVTTTAEPIEASPSLDENFLPTHDVPVFSGHPDTVANGGTAYCLFCGNDMPAHGNLRSYLKFDLSGVPASSKIYKATLHTYNKYSPSIGEPPYTPTDLTIEAYRVENDDWLENELTWNIAKAHYPPVGDALDSVFISENDDYNWNVWDVTFHVAQDVAGDKIVTIRLKSTA